MSTPAVVVEGTKGVTRLRDLKVPDGGARDVINVNPTIIEIELGHNPRDYHDPTNRAHLDQIKRSIKEEGYNPAFPLAGEV